MSRYGTAHLSLICLTIALCSTTMLPEAFGQTAGQLVEDSYAPLMMRQERNGISLPQAPAQHSHR